MLAVVFCAGVLHPALASAQTAITSSGLGTTVAAPPTGATNYQITGGTRLGSNLFHSFGAFSVGEGDTATFRNTAPATAISNIVSRVTGGEASNIFGTIDTLSYPGANLLLINPAGVVFGPNAKLDVSGAVHAGTADYVRFADGAKVYADPSRDSALTVARPEAFGFFGPAPASLSVQGSSLQVPSGQTLSLVGGFVAVQGSSSLNAPEGRIQLVSVGSGGEVSFSASDGTPNLRLTGFSAVGFVDLSEGPVLAAPTVLVRGWLFGAVPDGHIAFDGSMGPGGALVPEAFDEPPLHRFVIPAESGQLRGGNLFHSFSRFDLYADESATFQGPLAPPESPISNILARITGTEQSYIDGMIATDIPGANLFFFSPAGMVFGPAASLSVPGAVHVGTATSITFADGFNYSAVPPLPPVAGDAPPLSSASPVAFGFAAPTTAPISILGSVLHVQGGQMLSLAGGDMQIAGASLAAPSGRVQITSVASPGQVPVSVPVEPADLSSFANLGVIDITNFASIDASGDPGGSVLIRSGRLIVDNSSLTSFTLGVADSARSGIDVYARQDFVLANAAFAGTQTTAAGRAGDIIVNARTVRLMGGSAIRSQGGLGAGGDTTVTATDSINVSGFDLLEIPSQIATEIRGTAGAGNGGKVVIVAPSVTLAERGLISSTASEGRGGDIVLDDVGHLTVMGGAQIVTNATRTGAVGGTVRVAAESVLLSGEGSGLQSLNFGSDESPQPIAGDIFLDVGTLTLTDGAQIQSGSVVTPQGGNLSIAARHSIDISGTAGISSRAFNEKAGAVSLSADAVTLRNGFIDTGTFGGGDAGNISVQAKTVALSDGARVVSSSELGSTGRGGDVRLTATDSVSISGSNSGLFSNAAGSGPGGLITVNANVISLLDGATISASSTGEVSALAGDVNITFGDELFIRGGSIATESLFADGGNITITSTGSLLHLSGGQITTSVQSGTGGGGNITLGSHGHPLSFIVLFNSTVLANAFGGPGGNIGIFADVYLTSGTLVDASSALSTPGTIGVEARITDLSGTLAQLPEDTLQAATLLRAACAARISEGQASSLVVAGREGVPPEPEGLLWSPLGAVLAEHDLTRGAEHDSELFPRFMPIWLSSNCAR